MADVAILTRSKGPWGGFRPEPTPGVSKRGWIAVASKLGVLPGELGTEPDVLLCGQPLPFRLSLGPFRSFGLFAVGALSVLLLELGNEPGAADCLLGRDWRLPTARPTTVQTEGHMISNFC
ncbi:hypothetical protein ACFV14_37000 [Streptomyces zaomyceticus]|uniref:hypothetical protein n=1 Tax=Streptomyces zaomyceticus TaxID=68286 RepID=UPI0036791F61